VGAGGDFQGFQKPFAELTASSYFAVAGGFSAAVSKDFTGTVTDPIAPDPLSRTTTRISVACAARTRCRSNTIAARARYSYCFSSRSSLMCCFSVATVFPLPSRCTKNKSTPPFWCPSETF
jgi:hypothetical protein